MLTISVILGVLALLLAVASAAGYPPPLWVAVVLLAILALLQAIPLR